MREIASLGILGMAAPGAGIYVSVLPEIEAWLRITSLLIGIAVGTVSLILLVMKLKRRYMGDQGTTTK